MPVLIEGLRWAKPVLGLGINVTTLPWLHRLHCKISILKSSLATSSTLMTRSTTRLMVSPHHPSHPQNQPQNHPGHPHHNQHAGELRVPISYFAIRLVAKCSDEDVAISLIQHTAKRDKGPQFPPPIYPAVPSELPDHETVKVSCNKRNNNKIETMNKIFYFDRKLLPRVQFG